MLLQHFQHASNGLKYLEKWSEVMRRLSNNEEDQMDILWILEAAIAKFEKKQASSLMIKFLQAFYNFDVVDEDVILKWYYSDTNKDIKNYAAVFIQWLENASEEESDDE